jgi:hypothetical protein
MKRTITAFTAAAALALGASIAVQAQAPQIAFDANANFLKTPDNVFLGEIGGVATTSRGQVFVYTRTGHPYATLGDNRTFYRNGSRLFEFDANGNYVRELGQDVYGFNAAIGLRVDPQDNVWTIDEGANQVVKFDQQGRVALVLGRKPESINVRARGGGPGGGGRGAPAGAGRGGGGRGGALPGAGVPGSSFSSPADVTWDSAGNIYIADGIDTNNRVAKFDKDGKFITHWGSTGSGPGQFEGVKALAIDHQGNVYVADRGNKRIQVFDANGTFKSEFGGIGTPQAMCITNGPTQYLYISHVGNDDGMDDATIYKVQLDGRVVGHFGSAGKLPKELGIVNSIDCRNENNLLVGEMTNWRVQQLRLHP